MNCKLELNAVIFHVLSMIISQYVVSRGIEKVKWCLANARWWATVETKLSDWKRQMNWITGLVSNASTLNVPSPRWSEPTGRCISNQNAFEISFAVWCAFDIWISYTRSYDSFMQIWDIGRNGQRAMEGEKARERNGQRIGSERHILRTAANNNNLLWEIQFDIFINFMTNAFNKSASIKHNMKFFFRNVRLKARDASILILLSVLLRRSLPICFLLLLL